MGLATRGRSTARSRSRSTTGQKLTIKIGNVLHKPFRFIPEAVCFKSRCCPCFIHQNSTGNGAITPLNISLQGMWGCAVSPRKSKAGWTVTRVLPRSHSTLEAPESPLASRLRSFDMVGRLFGQACQMAQQRTQ